LTSEKGPSLTRPATRGSAEALPSFLGGRGLRFVFFGGKGGVGKTTAAAASALFQARRSPDERFLVVSTDPAHSLGDSFDQAIRGEVTPIAGVDNLFALELDAQALLDRFRAEHGEVLGKVAYRGTFLDEDDIGRFLNLALPGMEEIMAIIEVMDLVNADDFDLVVVDTAPTEHTLRMLELPEEMKLWIETLESMQQKHRYIVSTLVGRYRPDDVDAFLTRMNRDLNRVQRLFRDGRITEFVAVTIPEEMCVLETERLVQRLRGRRVPIEHLIINRVAPVGQACAQCEPEQRAQAASLQCLRDSLGDLTLWEVPLLPYEVRGLQRLEEYSQFLVGGEPRLIRPELGPQEPVPAGAGGLEPPSTRLVLFGGKGGVGKTTASAATAVHMAERASGLRFLVISTDPSHSLADSFDQAIGREITAISGYNNLYAWELDTHGLLEEYKEEQRAAARDFLDAARGRSRNARVRFDFEILDQVLDLAPPGLDEMLALIEVVKAAQGGEFDVVILDTAPTGHLLRFLGNPQPVREWYLTLARMTIKYQEMFRIDRLGALVARLARQIREVRAWLTDPANAEFIAVTIPEAMAVKETGRLLSSLAALDISCRQVLVNMIVPAGHCPLCTARREQGERYFRDFKVRFPAYRVAQAMRQPRPVRGLDALAVFGRAIYSREDASAAAAGSATGSTPARVPAVATVG
jgi:arsenite-transporting ATPase